MKNKILFIIAAILSALAINHAVASVTILGTRVVYPAKEKEVTVRLGNKGERPALVQAWIDNGDANASLDKINIPFIILPPVFRMEANKGQTLRIVYTGTALPKDKESVYWLNILDIPPKDKRMEGKNQLQLAIRSRIKIFYRPEGLDLSGAEKAAQTLVWRAGDKSNQLKAVNNSPYYVNVSLIEVEDASGKKGTSEHGDMIAPGEAKNFTITGAQINNIKSNIKYQFLDDFGAVRKQDGELAR
ncbi:MAG: fimbrial biogenesis chaperone [Gibbsiella quercinecans]|uniref:fimbrial biogenesis chaperone n=1 Tax=Gibbsiella quercinecans TaxID=929813 RepID=UPI003F3C78F5